MAIVLGVATIAAAFTLTDTMGRAADDLSSSAYDGTAAVVTAPALHLANDNENLTQPTIDAKAIDRVRAVPGVAKAAGDITDRDQVLGKDGKVVGGARGSASASTPRRPATQALALPPDAGRLGRRPRRGRHRRGHRRQAAPAHRRQIAHRDRRPGAELPRHRHHDFGSVDSLGTATIAVFDLHAAQGLFDKAGRVDSILVEAAAAVRRAGAPQPGRGAAAGQGPDAAKQDRFTLDGLKGFISIIKGVLLGFGGVALLVGAFTIFNSLSIIVAQRSREFGLLRLAGASRRQVLRTVVAEALIMGARPPAPSGSRPASGWPRASTRCSRRSGSTCRRPARSSPRARSSSRCWSASLVTLVAGLVPAGARRASRPSRRCATPQAPRAGRACRRASCGPSSAPSGARWRPRRVPRACWPGATRCVRRAARPSPPRR